MKVNTDILVIGSGIAGLWFALKASKYSKVLIITKKEKAESNTNYAQGGIASVISQDDSFELHIKDTLECGSGLCNAEAVKFIVENGPKLIHELIEAGVKFSKYKNELDLAREGGHSKNRIIHSKDLTGKAIEEALLDKAGKNKNIKILEHHTAVELITEHNIKYANNSDAKSNKEINCYGAYIYDELSNRVKTVISKATVLCTGGIGSVYMHTTNPAIATGDGIAMAYRAGAKIGNMEFIQFHPTSLYENKLTKRNGQSFLISEAVRGAGGRLLNRLGEEFMYKYDKRGSLAPRDIVARAIDSEMKKFGDNYVYLDIRHLGINKIKKLFPTIYNKCKSIGINISKDLIPVVPAAHYICGGIVTDMRGKTSINNLYALGECAMTGVHGANRLASNSLLEALVYSESASQYLKNEINNITMIDRSKVPDWDTSGTENNDEWVLISHNKTEIKQIMHNYVGIVRSNLRLNRALSRIKFIKRETEQFYKKTKISRELLELRNIVLIAYLITRSALKRKESRGLHFSTDYPKSQDRYKKDTILQHKKYLNKPLA